MKIFSKIQDRIFEMSHSTSPSILFSKLRDREWSSILQVSRKISMNDLELTTLKTLWDLARNGSLKNFLIQIERADLFEWESSPIKIPNREFETQQKILNVKFREIVRKKRIALVGPCRTLLGANLGSQIDSHDLVVRLNGHWPIPENRKLDLGQNLDNLMQKLLKSRELAFLLKGLGSRSKWCFSRFFFVEDLRCRKVYNGCQETLSRLL